MHGGEGMVNTMYVCVSVCTCICVFMYIHAYLYACVYMCVHDVFMRVCMHGDVCMYVCA